MKPKKLYRCPVCDEVLTDVQWEADFEIGGNGMCPCDFMLNESRVYHEYDIYTLQTSEVKSE